MVSPAIRMFAAGAAILFVAAVAAAQTAPLPAVAAPGSHAATGLSFPPQIATAPKVHSLDFGKTHSRPELGYGWSYEFDSQLTASVYVYDAGQKTISTGPENPPVFDQAYKAIYQVAQDAGRYEKLKPIMGPAFRPVDHMVFRCVTFSAVTRPTGSRSTRRFC